MRSKCVASVESEGFRRLFSLVNKLRKDAQHYCRCLTQMNSQCKTTRFEKWKKVFGIMDDFKVKFLNIEFDNDKDFKST